MKFPFSMLRDFVETKLTPEDIGNLLTMAGFELEGIESHDGDSVLDIKVMSNRGDGLSVFGLAREVLAKDQEAKSTELYRNAAARFEGLSQSTEPANTTVSIETSACTRYACAMLKNVTRQTSPAWMEARLIQAGMRPICLLVDATNYVMLEVGQPLHAFDFDKLQGGRIVVREARDGEELTTLNGVEHKLSMGQTMICDAFRPVGVAGVMGGLDSEISPSTQNVLLESAHFQSVSVRRTRKQLGLNTEASYRFERSVDPDGVVAAIYRTVQLIQEADPGITVSAVVDEYPQKPTRVEIPLRVSRASRLLGMDVSPRNAQAYLSRLGFQISQIDEDRFSVTSPSWRPDIVREIDLVEELGRVQGYEKIPERLVEGATKMGGAQGFELWTDWLRESALRAGLSQIISHSLRDLHPLDDRRVDRVGPRSPASPEMAYLRNSLLPGLVDAARRNNPKDVQFFEIGKVFGIGKGSYLEDLHFAALVAGPIVSAGWSYSEFGQGSFFTLKGLLETVLDAVGVKVDFAPQSDDPRLHPTRQATLSISGKALGFLGQIHPDLAAEFGLPADSIVFELRVEVAFQHRKTQLDLHSISRNPSVRRDMSVLIDRTVPFETVAQTIQNAVGPVLERQWLFDVYSGANIPAGKHALGVAIQLRKLDSTFTDEEANQVRDRAVAALVGLGATMR